MRTNEMSDELKAIVDELKEYYMLQSTAELFKLSISRLHTHMKETKERNKRK